MSDIVFSIIMPTYNSEATIARALLSIRLQSFPKENLEVIVVDGGSTDNTVKLAKEFDFVRIINNPERVPEYAKMYGIKNARGQYVIKMDSDEEFIHTDTLEQRYSVFKNNADCHLIVADKLIVPNEGSDNYLSSLYATAIGDPFTYFIYRPKATTAETFKDNIINIDGNTYCMKFNNGDRRPIADAGTTTFDLFYVRHHNLADINNINDITTISDKIMDKCSCCYCIRGDAVMHNAFVGFKKYIRKIRFRVINNVFASLDAGFVNRKNSSQNKKLFFPLYTISLVVPLFDAIKMSVEHKSATFLLHPLYCIITLFYIVKYMTMKLFGITKTNKEY